MVKFSDTFEAKLDAWRQFLTAQGHADQMAQQLEARARFHGSKIGVEYDEALTRSYFIPTKVTNPLEELL